jgi:putative ABC transport system permease protein
MLSRGLVLSFGDVLRSTGYDVRITATDALPGAGPDVEDATATVEGLRALPEVARAAVLRFGSGSVDLPGAPGQAVTVIGARPGEGEWQVVRGGELADGAVVLNEGLARELGAEPGTVVGIRPGSEGGSPLPPVPLQVAAIAEFPFDQRGERTLAVSLATFRSARFGEDEDVAPLLLVASRPGVGAEAAAAAVRAARPDLHAFTIDEFLDRFQRGDFSYFRQISVVLSTVTSFFAFLLVATLLTVSVNQRRGEVAALRALGFARARVAQQLLAEAALFVGVGGVIAFPLGLLLGRGLDAILRGMPGIPARIHFFVLEPRAAVLHVALLGAMGVLAAAHPVALAVRAPIADTLRREVL